MAQRRANEGVEGMGCETEAYLHRVCFCITRGQTHHTNGNRYYRWVSTLPHGPHWLRDSEGTNKRVASERRNRVLGNLFSTVDRCRVGSKHRQEGNKLLLNAATVRDEYMLPRIDHMFDVLEGMELVSHGLYKNWNDRPDRKHGESKAVRWGRRKARHTGPSEGWSRPPNTKNVKGRLSSSLTLLLWIGPTSVFYE